MVHFKYAITFKLHSASEFLFCSQYYNKSTFEWECINNSNSKIHSDLLIFLYMIMIIFLWSKVWFSVCYHSVSCFRFTLSVLKPKHWASSSSSSSPFRLHKNASFSISGSDYSFSKFHSHPSFYFSVHFRNVSYISTK